MGVVMRGKEQLRQFATEVFKTMPNFRVQFPNRFAAQEWGAARWVITANWQGLFEGVDCTGKAIEFTGLSLYGFRDGKLVSNSDCWDYTVMMKAFGVLRESLRILR
jgi:predicted ester cyclase